MKVAISVLQIENNTHQFQIHHAFGDVDFY